MNKTQFFTLSGALLASTALSGAASAGSVGRYDASGNFTTSPLTIANTLFSTTASTANAVTIGADSRDRDFGMRYNNNFSGSTRFTTEFSIAGARFISGGLTTANVKMLIGSANNSVITSISGSLSCVSFNALVDLMVVEDCHYTSDATITGTTIGIAFTGVTFNNASSLATAGSSVTLTGRVLSATNNTQIFEASSTGTILTSAAPFQITVTTGPDATASATTTPNAFSSLSTPASSPLSMTLATVRVSGTGALQASLSTQPVMVSSHASTAQISVTSSILSNGAVRSVNLVQGGGGASLSALSYLTAANFSGGTVTFTLSNTAFSNAGSESFQVIVVFQGTTAIPSAAAGTVTASVGHSTLGIQQVSGSGTTAVVNQGGFRAGVNTFNASTNGPFGSYLRIHNNGAVAGTVTITIRSDDHTSGTVLGSSFSTANIAPGSTMQLTAAEMEGTATSTKLPGGGANVPTASRQGSYTLSITGPIIGYVQHILFDGNSVADLSGYRNSGNTSNQP